MKGKVKFFNEKKNFGFVTGEDEKDYFVHASALGEGVKLFEGDAVEFEGEEGEKGPKATSVKKVEQEESESAEESEE